MRHLRLLIGVLLLLGGLVVAGCASDSEGGTEELTDEAQADEPEQPDDSGSGSAPTTRDLACPETSTTAASTSTSGLSICAAIERIPPDELPPPEDRDYVVWSGTISGSIQTPSCEPVSQAGKMILVVFADGDLSGAGETQTGAYTCDNGASIPASSNSYGIDGKKTDVFTLVFTDGVTLSSGPIEDGHAVLVQDTGAGLLTIELTCEGSNC